MYRNLQPTDRTENNKPEYNIIDPYTNYKTYCYNNVTDKNIITKDDLFLYHRGLTQLPHIKYVGKKFVCYDNQLLSLAGCPIYVCGSFDCSGNALINLDGCPFHIGKYFSCHRNKVKLNRPKNVYIGRGFRNENGNIR